MADLSAEISYILLLSYTPDFSESVDFFVTAKDLPVRPLRSLPAEGPGTEGIGGGRGSSGPLMKRIARFGRVSQRISARNWPLVLIRAKNRADRA